MQPNPFFVRTNMYITSTAEKKWHKNLDSINLKKNT
jgi:hypothetical protein